MEPAVIFVYTRIMPLAGDAETPTGRRQFRAAFSSRAMCFVAGLATAGLLVVATIFCLLDGDYLFPGGDSSAARKRAVASPARTRNTSQPSELAKLLAAPLQPVGAAAPVTRKAEVLPTLFSLRDEARKIGERNDDLAPVAQEFAELLQDVAAAYAEKPDLLPLVRAGADVWRGIRSDEPLPLLIGLLGAEYQSDKISKHMDRVESIHAKWVACRNRLAAIAKQCARPEQDGAVTTARFEESGGFLSVADDTLTLWNTSGSPLTNVMVVTELIGRSGERFNNLFFIDRWDPDQALRAICPSDRPRRETVRGVVRVRYQVMSDELTSRLVELRLGQ
jgi:hypothetical protein